MSRYVTLCHVMSRQVVRRVDPRARPLGQILRYHVSEPLGADVHIGLTDQGEVVFCRGQVSVHQLSTVQSWRGR